MVLKFDGNIINKLYATQLNNISNSGQIAIYSGCNLTIFNDFDINISLGVLFYQGQFIPILTKDVSISRNNSSSTRIDTILVNTVGSVSVLVGNPSTVPSPTDYDPTLYTALALIFVYPSTTSLSLNNIKDIKVLNTITTGSFTGDVIPSIDDNYVVGSINNRYLSSHIVKNTTNEYEIIEDDSTRSTPSSGNLIIYSRSDGNLYYKDSNGDEHLIF